LVLLESGRLIDTTRGELVPENAAVVKPSTPDEIAYIGVPSNAEMTARVVPHGSLRANPNSALAQATKNGLQESAIIGAGMTQDGFVSSPINLPHGFSLRHLSLPSGTTTPFYRRDSVEVLFVHRGLANWTNGMGQSVELTEGDTFSVPIGQTRALDTEHGAELYVVLGGDDPGPLLLS
jgi:quercetin dioxygenase-like cupin family protein